MEDGEGDPLNGISTVTFNIYSVSTGGATVWTEPHTVNVDNGEFSVLLGSVNNSDLDPLNDNFQTVNFNSTTQFWLGITVGSDSEMTPRKRFLFVSSAFDADIIESDPEFVASEAYGITSTDIANWNSLETVIESRTSPPAAPVTGQIWLRTDL